jgi:thiamine-phosphate pyrophosphorylase
MKLIVISSSKNRPEDPKIMTELFECGLNLYHLRKPSMSTQDMRKIIEQVPEHFHNRIVIHSHHKLASQYDLKGVHLTGVHRRRKFSTWLRLRLLQMRNDTLTVSTSFHKLANVYTNKSEYSYVFLGTIFDRLTSKFHAGYSEHSILAITSKSAIPLIARGGTSGEVIAKSAELGFAGIAFASAVWDSDSPVQSWKNIIDKCREQSISFE